MTGEEINILIMFGGVLLFASTIGIYDLLAERQQRRHREDRRRSA